MRLPFDRLCDTLNSWLCYGKHCCPSLLSDVLLLLIIKDAKIAVVFCFNISTFTSPPDRFLPCSPGWIAAGKPSTFSASSRTPFTGVCHYTSSHLSYLDVPWMRLAWMLNNSVPSYSYQWFWTQDPKKNVQISQEWVGQISHPGVPDDISEPGQQQGRVTVRSLWPP